MTLRKKLQDFSIIEGKSIENQFEDIAKTILYDGYIKIRDEYRVYIKTVEFYLHTEDGSPFNISDPIVYHRNGKFPNRVVPYFPLMTLHAHVSGFDITFENETLRYRASALIRTYSIYDIKKGVFVKTKPEHFQESNKDKIPYDGRSTYLYDFINGFPMTEECNGITWIDDERINISEDFKKISKGKRKNVYKNYKGEDQSTIQAWANRCWSFTRTNDVHP